MEPLHLLNPSNNPDLYDNTQQLRIFPAAYMVLDTACFVYRSQWSPLHIEISTLAYEMITNC
jgi:hypothetical protein